MPRKKLERVYHQLTPQERFELSLEAMARGDHPEQERLMDTCQLMSYLETDAAYTSLMEATTLFVGQVMMDLRPVLAQLQMADWLLDRFVEDVIPFEARSPRELALSEHLSAMVIVCASRARGMWEAFGATCEDHLGVDAEVVAGAMFPEIREDMACHHEILQSVPSAERFQADYREALQQSWLQLRRKARGRSKKSSPKPSSGKGSHKPKP
jgi:hypothetical protein